MSTLEHAQSMLDAYTTAEREILLGKAVRLGGTGIDRWLQMEDLAEVRKGRVEWEGKVATLQAQAAGTPTFAGLGYSLSDFSS